MSYLQDAINIEFVVKFIVIYFFIIWIALILWVVKDISIRTNNIYLQIFCLLLVLVGTPLGVFLYLLIRPGKTLYEKYYDEIEENLDIFEEIIAERRAKKLDQFAVQNQAISQKKPQETSREKTKNRFGNTSEKKKLEGKKKKTNIKVKKF